MIFVTDTYLSDEYFDRLDDAYHKTYTLGEVKNYVRLFVDQRNLSSVHLGLLEWIRQMEEAMKILGIEG